MGTRILRGAELAADLRRRIAIAVTELTHEGGGALLLATLLVGDNPAALAYRGSIARTFARVGIGHRSVELPATTTPTSLAATLTTLNTDPAVTGVLVLMPLPPPLSPDLVWEHLSPLKDVDGVTPTNAGRMHLGLPSLRPSTPEGGIELLDHYGIPIAGQRAVVIGRSNVVGRPLAALLTQRHATVTVCHRQTRDLAAVAREGDLVCLAAGHAGLLRRDMVRPGAVVLDFGVNVAGDRLVGDADYERLLDHAGAITPVPGGTGPVTTLVLARNTVAAGFAARRGHLDHLPML